MGHLAAVRANFQADVIHLEYEPLRLNILRDSLDLSYIRFLELGPPELEPIDVERIVRELQRFRSLELLTITSPQPPNTSLDPNSTLLGLNPLESRAIQRTDGTN